VVSPSDAPSDQPADSHVSVFLAEAIDALFESSLPAGRIWVDGTFGRGGHSSAILSRMETGDRLVVIDRDPEAIKVARILAQTDERVIVVHGSWEAAVEELARRGIERWHGVLLDLGVSSPQLESGTRGFSFRHDGPLDMRMDPGSGQSAAVWLNQAEERDIVRVLREYGEEMQARRIARSILDRRPLTTTADLVAAVEAVVHRSATGRHEATRTFQAVRIFVNDELGLLERSLPVFFAGLEPGARLVVISFHSLEDRIVKHFFKDQSSPPVLPRRMPVRADTIKPVARLIGRSRAPSPAETNRNPRARSARIRVLEKIA
jgi:16S rRNA (cytosine1402-N4)-methyltransferase